MIRPSFFRTAKKVVAGTPARKNRGFGAVPFPQRQPPRIAVRPVEQRTAVQFVLAVCKVFPPVLQRRRLVPLVRQDQFEFVRHIHCLSARKKAAAAGRLSGGLPDQ